MKKHFISLSTVLSIAVTGQQTMLKHFDPSVVIPVVESYDGAGYLTGHNDYGDEEFAEKYEILGTAKLLGVAAIHRGEEGTPGSVLGSYRAYSVGTSGLPQNQLANKNFSYSEIPVDGQIKTVMFDQPADINSSFFVSFRLGDYSHGGLGTKRIAIAHSPDGTRPSSDLNVFGRNVIRWHSHGAATWKDYRTENFSDYEPAIHFALFPIVELGNMAVVDLNHKTSVGAVYPNPSKGNFNIPITSKVTGKTMLKLYDMGGKLISEKQTDLKVGSTDIRFEENQLKPGTYILLIQTSEGSISQKILIN